MAKCEFRNHYKKIHMAAIHVYTRRNKMKKEEIAVTDVEETDPRDIHLVNIYICKACKSVWAGPAKFCPFCGLKIQNITKLEGSHDDLSIQSWG